MKKFAVVPVRSLWALPLPAYRCCSTAYFPSWAFLPQTVELNKLHGDGILTWAHLMCKIIVWTIQGSGLEAAFSNAIVAYFPNIVKESLRNLA